MGCWRTRQDQTPLETLFQWYVCAIEERVLKERGQTANCGIGTQGLVFVVDSNDRGRMEEARQELHRIINDREMKDSLLLVFANKQDLRLKPGETRAAGELGAMSPEEVEEVLKLKSLKRTYAVMPAVGITGDGLLEGMV